MTAPTPQVSFLARNIVNQLADLYMETTVEGSPERAAFVKYRQSTNDQADEFVARLLAQHDAEVARQAKREVWKQAQVLRERLGRLTGPAVSEAIVGKRIEEAVAAVLALVADDAPEASVPADGSGQ